MNPPSPCVLVASESGIARGFVQVILHADGVQTREVSTPERALAALDPAPDGRRLEPLLLIDATLLGQQGPRGNVWGRLVRDHPELPVVCLKLDGADRAPAELEGRVRAHVDPMVPRALVESVRGALRPRPRSARGRPAVHRTAG